MPLRIDAAKTDAAKTMRPSIVTAELRYRQTALLPTSDRAAVDAAAL